MAHIQEGELTGSGKRIGIVVSRFNEIVTKELLHGALNHLRRSGVRESDLEVVWVPGSFEIPLALKALAETKKIDALIVLGCIIRGETSNYEHIARATTDAIQRVMLDYRLPVGFGLLTVESFEQAIERCGGKIGNRGREAAQSALEMASLMNQFKEKHEGEKVLSDSLKTWNRL